MQVFRYSGVQDGAPPCKVLPEYLNTRIPEHPNTEPFSRYNYCSCQAHGRFADGSEIHRRGVKNGRESKAARKAAPARQGQSERHGGQTKVECVSQSEE